MITKYCSFLRPTRSVATMRGSAVPSARIPISVGPATWWVVASRTVPYRLIIPYYTIWSIPYRTYCTLAYHPVVRMPTCQGLIYLDQL